ncbi:MAG: hypothetical protein ACK4FJ_07200 [Ferrovibrio sp.]|uniref:hypothetical protein n=1 Tax=Ferrovibrio sp. TaxID=1917215 RepID=UPI00391D7397
MSVETATIPIGTVFVECSRFLPRAAQPRWRVERIVALPNLPEHAAIRKLEPGGEERLITLQALALSGKYTRLDS